MVPLDNQQLELQLVLAVHFKLVVMRNREKLKYTEDHFNRNLELQACFCLFKLFPIPHDNQL